MSKGSGGVRNADYTSTYEFLDKLSDKGWIMNYIDDDEVYIFNKLHLDKFDFDKYKDTITDYLSKFGIEAPRFILHIEEDDTKISFSGKGISCDRAFYIRNGKLVAEHEYLDIKDDYQQHGIAPLIYRMNMEDYKKMGVKEVEMFANLDVGGYAWAKYGFSTDQFTANKMVASFKDETRPKAERIVKDFYKTHDKSENFPMNLLSGFKEDLLGTKWSGHLSLKDKKQMKIFDDYLSGREKKFGLK